MDAATLRPQLPSLGFADMDKVKRDEDAYQSRNTGVQPTLPSTSTIAISPTYQYPQGPPPPYSHPTIPPNPQSHPNTSPASHAAPDTPPASRRSSGEEKDASAKQPPRQSLPSISEALGVDSQTAYQTPLPPQSTQPRSAVTSSPSPAKRPYAMDPPHIPRDHYPTTAHASYTHSNPAQSYHHPPPPPPPLPHDPSRSVLNDARPSLQLQTIRSPTARPPPQPASYPYSPANPSPVQDRQPFPQQAPPQASHAFSYGYAPYPPRYPQGPVPTSAAAGPVYQPSSIHGAPASAPAPIPAPTAPTWKADGAAPRFAADERTYGESVKRHLDLYDLEAALNDIASSCSILGDFSRRYGDRLYHTPRAAPSLSSLPSIIEVEDMISKSRLQTEALIKIRENVIAQQAAYEQQTAEQQHNKAYAEPVPPPHAREGEDGKSEFAGPETKKRRGRAAPAGRCHSCNRAETPEWRRGPDGARTLCNACGLHYAKLTRKQNSANKAAAVSSTNLRPKETMP